MAGRHVAAISLKKFLIHPIIIMAKQNPPKDPTSAARTARMKAGLIKGGGKRMSLNLTGKLVAKLDQLVADGIGEDHSSVIRTLIDAQIEDEE